MLAGLDSINIAYMQHYLWYIFYVVCFMIFPTMATITIMQLLIISAIVGYMFMKLEEIFNYKKIIWLFFIPLLFLPVIDNNLFPLRNSVITYLLLLLLFEILLLYKRKDKIETKKDFIKIVILVSVISALKTEYMCLILMIPIIIKFIFGIRFKDVCILMISMLLITEIINIPQKDEKNNTYILTSMVNPLSTIIKSENVKGIEEEDIKKIDTVINYEKLKENASYTNIHVYFSDKYSNRKITTKQKIDFIVTYIKIVVNNMDLFLENRFTTFLYTSGMKKDYINHTGHENPNWTLKVEYNPEFYKLKKYYMKNCVDPIFGQELREYTIKIINCRDLNDYNKTNFLHPICYNVIPQVIGLGLILIYGFIKRNLMYISMTAVCLIEFVLIFLTAPAAFWMYYMPIYMSANMIIMYLIVNSIYKKGEKKV